MTAPIRPTTVESSNFSLPPRPYAHSICKSHQLCLPRDLSPTASHPPSTGLAPLFSETAVGVFCALLFVCLPLLEDELCRPRSICLFTEIAQVPDTKRVLSKYLLNTLQGFLIPPCPLTVSPHSSQKDPVQICQISPSLLCSEPTPGAHLMLIKVLFMAPKTLHNCLVSFKILPPTLSPLLTRLQPLASSLLLEPARLSSCLRAFAQAASSALPNVLPQMALWHPPPLLQVFVQMSQSQGGLFKNATPLPHPDTLQPLSLLLLYFLKIYLIGF